MARSRVSLSRPYYATTSTRASRSRGPFFSRVKHDIQVPAVPLYEQVEVHMVPNLPMQLVDIRIWWNNKKVLSLTLPAQEVHVHF